MYLYIHSDMSNQSITIKTLRKELDLNQAELARALSVTQATVARWESSVAQPTGDAARRLHQLQAMMTKPKERRLIQETLRANGGVAAVAALLSLGSAVDGTAVGVFGAGTLFGPAGIAGSIAAGLLYRLLQKAKKENRK